jgi:integrase
VFTTAAGTPRDKDNARERVLRPVVRHADELLAADDLEPLPRITPHKLRHTFASILFALGWQAPDVMAQLGHTDPAFTLRVYAHVMRRGGDERERLRALVEGANGHPMGTSADVPAAAPPAGAVR